jgi:MFS family permease
MTVSRAERSVASAGYNFVRWIGGAVAPWLAGQLAERVNPHVPFYVGSGALAVALIWLFLRRGYLASLQAPPAAEIRTEDDALGAVMPSRPLDLQPSSWELDQTDDERSAEAG